MAYVGGSIVILSVNRKCPQGGVLTPFLWYIVVDHLQTLAKDIAIWVRVMCETTIK